MSLTSLLLQTVKYSPVEVTSSFYICKCRDGFFFCGGNTIICCDRHGIYFVFFKIVYKVFTQEQSTKTNLLEFTQTLNLLESISPKKVGKPVASSFSSTGSLSLCKDPSLSILLSKAFLGLFQFYQCFLLFLRVVYETKSSFGFTYFGLQTVWLDSLGAPSLAILIMLYFINMGAS